jgi:3-hydroxyisobutyrate dehydrogenase-like beta-hydroxyacid dehydrogenase
MSANLLSEGIQLRGYDVSPERREEFSEAGGTVANSPADAVQGCWAALLSLPTSDISRDVCLGPGGIAEAGVADLHVYDTTTGPPADAVEFAAALSGYGVSYSDSTVSGNGEVAGRGELVVMMGGSEESYELGSPIFEAIGRSHHHVGTVGSGARMKLIVNHVLSIHRLALAEGLVVAELGDMDLDKTLAILKDGAAYSRAMDLWGERMVEGDHEPPFARLRQTHKDSRLIVEHGTDLGAPMDLMAVVRAALTEGMDEGLADHDNSAVMEVVRRRAGIGRVE